MRKTFYQSKLFDFDRTFGSAFDCRLAKVAAVKVDGYESDVEYLKSGIIEIGFR